MLNGRRKVLLATGAALLVASLSSRRSGAGGVDEAGGATSVRALQAAATQAYANREFSEVSDPCPWVACHCYHRAQRHAGLPPCRLVPPDLVLQAV